MISNLSLNSVDLMKKLLVLGAEARLHDPAKAGRQHWLQKESDCFIPRKRATLFVFCTHTLRVSYMTPFDSLRKHRIVLCCAYLLKLG